MNSIILLNKENKVPTDGLSMIARKGEHPIMVMASDKSGKQSAQEFIQVIDDKAILTMMNRFKEIQDAGKVADLLVDYEHDSEFSDRSSEAAGWIKNLQNRADGLYGKIEWSDKGQEAIEGRRFKFLSPVFSLTNCEDLGSNRVRPLQLDGAAVTNKPNMKDMRPLMNKENTIVPVAGQKQKGVQMDYKTMLLKMLGLDATATDEQIQAKMGEASAAMANCDTMKKENETLKNRVTGFEKKELEGAVEKDLEEFKGVITDREAVKAGLMANREGTVKILKAMVPTGKALNSGSASAPAGGSGTQSVQDKVRKQIDFIEEVKLRNRLTSQVDAYQLARRMKPELFA